MQIQCPAEAYGRRIDAWDLDQVAGVMARDNNAIRSYADKWTVGSGPALSQRDDHASILRGYLAENPAIESRSVQECGISGSMSATAGRLRVASTAAEPPPASTSAKGPP